MRKNLILTAAMLAVMELNKQQEPLDIPRHCKDRDLCLANNRCSLGCWKLDEPVSEKDNG